MKKHFLDKPILRGWFWFIVMPYNLKKWIEEHKTTNKEGNHARAKST